MEPPDPSELRVNLRDVLITGVAVLAAVVGAAVGTAYFTDPPQEERIVAVTSDELSDLLAALRRVERNPEATPAERRIAERADDLIDGIESGEIEVVDPPATTTTVPPATTTTTSTTSSTTTTVPVHRWPGQSDAPLIPPVVDQLLPD